MKCPKCGHAAGAGQAFCEACGHPMMKGTGRKAPVSRKVGRFARKEYMGCIKRARIAILVVAAFLYLGALVHFLMIRALSNAQTSVLVVCIVVELFLGLFYIGLFFWAARNPFGAALTALVLYLTLMVVSFAVNPSILLSLGIIVGIIEIGIRVIIILMLISGMKAGLAYRRFQGDEAAPAR